MKIYISYDMEGLTGVHHSDHVAAGRTKYSVFQRIGMEELNAAIEVATLVIVRTPLGTS